MTKQISEQKQYHELSYYTLAHENQSFIHQHIVDAYTAQTADEQTKPIAITFSLIGLYLYLKKNFTGKQIQLAHMQMAKKKHIWPKFVLPKVKGDITVSNVMAESQGQMRDEMIGKWCQSVWEAYSKNHKQVALLWQYFDEKVIK